MKRRQNEANEMVAVVLVTCHLVLIVLAACTCDPKMSSIIHAACHTINSILIYNQPTLRHILLNDECLLVIKVVLKVEEGSPRLPLVCFRFPVEGSFLP